MACIASWPDLSPPDLFRGLLADALRLHGTKSSLTWNLFVPFAVGVWGFDEETGRAIDVLARDRMMDFQELPDEALADLLEKHGRPTDLKTALPKSVEQGSVTDEAPNNKRSK